MLIQPRTIGVVGGGSAGYLAALYLKKHLPRAEVTVVESSRIPVVGVGEATTQTMMRFLHETMGFPLSEFLAEARPTLKLGIRFAWGNPRNTHYNSPFGPSDLTNALVETGDGRNASLLSMLMEAGKVPFLTHDGRLRPATNGRIAYHIDNLHFLAYLRRKLAALGCRHLDAEIAEAVPSRDGNAIDHLRMRDGTDTRFDLYLDCSGFRSLLLEQALETPWISYGSSLRTDRAVVGRRSNAGQILPYTSASTLKHGWLWNTPMQHEDHLGYVFSSQHCSDDEAWAELRTHCDSIQEGRVVHFRSGRHARSWNGNVVAIGNAFAFIEPLESTGIHMILFQLERLCRRLTCVVADADPVLSYNRKVNARWDSLRWFIALHFRFNSRLSTPFWQECRAEADVSGLDDYLDHFRRFGPLSATPDHPLFAQLSQDRVFPVFAYDMHRAHGTAEPWPLRSTPEPARRAFRQRFALDQALVRNALPHREALTRLAHEDSGYTGTHSEEPQSLPTAMV